MRPAARSRVRATLLVRLECAPTCLSLKRARDLCPNVVQLPYDLDAYGHVAELMYRSLWRLSPFVLGMSCDEAYVDVTHLVAAQPTGAAREAALMDLVHELRAEIDLGTPRAVPHLSASLATCCWPRSRQRKPDGAFRLDPHTPEGQRVLGSLPLRELPQVGWQTGNLLASRLGPDATNLLKHQCRFSASCWETSVAR